MVREQETTCLGCLLYLLEWVFSHPGNFKQETKWVRPSLHDKDVKAIWCSRPEWLVLSIHLKTQKQLRIGNGTNIEIFENSSFMCPIKEIKNWLQASTLQTYSNLPLFRNYNGECYTGADFNKDLIKLTAGWLESGKNAHTVFVVGSQLKWQEMAEEIKRQGRWSSQ